MITLKLNTRETQIINVALNGFISGELDEIESQKQMTMPDRRHIAACRENIRLAKVMRKNLLWTTN